MSDGREERKEQEERRKWDAERNGEDRPARFPGDDQFERFPADQWRPERRES